MVLEKETGHLVFLSTMDEKKMIFENCGIDHLVIIEFTRKFSEMKACEFVEKVLVDHIGTRNVVVGYDHHFGYQGEGNFNTIKECARALGINVVQVDGFKESGKVISSSLIRDALVRGRLSEANKWLGYEYSLKGSVVEGKKIGRKIGFPTANLRPSDRNKLIPGNGVYAVNAYIDNRKYSGMLSIGYNPTINKNRSARSIEVNIFDFDENIYGREIEVIFRYRLRDEKEFGSTGELSRQMKRDKKNTLNLLE
jgi:riboflavin kinase/FMN adenylyltransferase